MAKANRELVIHIKGDTKHFEIAMDKTSESMKRFRKETKQAHGASSEMARGFQKAASQASVLYGPLNGVSGRLNAIATGLRISNVAWVGLGAAVSGAIVSLMHGNRVLAETEHQVARLNGVLKATNNAAGYSAESLDNFARAVAENTLASVAGVRDAIGILGTFKSVSGETFKDTINLSQDIAEVMGTSITSAATMMGKALENPLTGLTALNRAGVTFSGAQKEMIKEAMHVGDVFAAQAIIMETVEAQLKGIAEEVAKGTQAGTIDTFVQKWDTFNESLAKTLATSQGVKGFLGWVNTWLDNAAKKMDPSLMSIDELNQAISDTEKEMAELEKRMTPQQLKGEGRYQELLREYNAYILVRGKRLRADNQAARDSQEEQAKIDRANRQEAYRLRLKDYEKAQKKFEEKRKAFAKQAASREEFALATDKVDAQYELQLEKLDNYYSAEQYKLRGHNDLLLQLEEDYLAARNELRASYDAQWEEAQRLQEDALSEKLDKDHPLEKDIEDWETFKDNMDRKAAVWKSYADSVGVAFGVVAQHMEEGSKAQKAFLALEKATLLAQALMNTFAAATAAMNMPTGATPIQRMAAYAAVLAQGMTAVSAISGVVMSARAGGGPVKAGGSYWVGEHGPEVVTMPGNGVVTSNEALTPNVNVNIIEDASRAGTVDQQGDTLNVFVAAAMSQLSNDFNSGRGLFREMENKYGLTRR